MTDSAAALTKQGIARQQTGDTSGATAFFVQATQADPAYEMAWLWLSSCLTAAGQKRYCLDQALLANPQSAPARKGLAQLGDVRAVRPAALGGESIAPPAELVADRVRHCPHCGAETIGTMQFCAACGKRISDPVGAPAAAVKPKNKHDTLYLIVFVVIALVGGMIYILNGGRFNGESTPTQPDAISAFVMCKQFVTENLKAPATAVFPTYGDAGTQTDKLSTVQFRARAFVDSQNGFGANVRTRYTCTVTSTGGPNWRLDNLTTDP